MEVDVPNVHGQLNSLIVLGLDGDRAIAASDGDPSGRLRKSERVGEGGHVMRNLRVRVVRREAQLLRHVILVLIEPPVDLAEVEAEVTDGNHKHQ